MNYFSTRRCSQGLSFQETVLTGLAPDGGLYIPEFIPKLPPNWETDWQTYSFIDLVVAILSLYISPEEITKDELRTLAEQSYKNFRVPDVVPLHRLRDKVFVLELFHGPTFAFKDIALQFLGNLFEFLLLRRNASKSSGQTADKLTVVGATSGDTGSAAIYGLRNKANISIFILHPRGRVSPIQEAQMTTITDPNVHNIAVEGSFDDCQDIVKTLFADREFNDRHSLGAVNSINWARILVQIVYYFSSYFRIRPHLPDSHAEIQYAVPTGNFGDILAGYYAKKMGLPMAKLVVATNSNDILARFWQTGIYQKLSSHDGATVDGVQETLSPAMDILVSSNFERLLWYLAHESSCGTDGDRRRDACNTVDGWMRQVKNDGRVEVPVSVLDLARRDFVAVRVSDDLTLDTIRLHFQSTPSYVSDPHTAVGLAAAHIIEQQNPPSVYQIVLATAHPAKFSEAVSRALDDSSDFNFERDILPVEFRGMLEREKRVTIVERPDVDLVKNVIEEVARTETKLL